MSDNFSVSENLQVANLLCDTWQRVHFMTVHGEYNEDGSATLVVYYRAPVADKLCKHCDHYSILHHFPRFTKHDDVYLAAYRQCDSTVRAFEDFPIPVKWLSYCYPSGRVVLIPEGNTVQGGAISLHRIISGCKFAIRRVYEEAGVAVPPDQSFPPPEVTIDVW